MRQRPREKPNKRRQPKNAKKAKEHDPFNDDAPDADVEESDEDGWDCDSDNDGEEEGEAE